MPKPVKKAASKRKPAKPQKASTDPNRRASQLIAEHLDKLSQGKWGTQTETLPDAKAQGDSFEAQYRARMAELGRKGGQKSGAKRMEMPEKQRRAIAQKAAAARWSKKSK